MKKIWLCFFPVIFLTGCALFGSSDSVGTLASGTLSEIARTEYIIGPEDELEISVWKNTDLSKTVTVRPDGMISLPLVGDVPAAGSSPSYLRDVIADKLKEYQQTVTVAVIVTTINSYKIFVFGEVAKPGMYKAKRHTTIAQVIAAAGGFTRFASKGRIVLIREKGDTDNSGTKIVIDFTKITDVDEKKDENMTLKPGDTIFVP